MRDHSNHIQLSRTEAVKQTLEALKGVEGGFGLFNRSESAGTCACTERVSLANAVGRVLAQDVCAQCDMPNVLTCAMDSVALHWESFENLSEGELPDTTNWVRGRDWQFANTGVAMPEGFDTAIVIEHVEVSEDEQHIKINAAPSKKGAGTRPAGSNFTAGTLLAQAGLKITPDVAARIASGNFASVNVVRKPRVAFIPTGNELVAPGIPYDTARSATFAGRGRNFETNSLLVQAKTETWGGVYVPFDIVPDEKNSIKAAIENAVQVADIVVLNAGSSKGSDDWSCEVMEEVGNIICHQTNHGPGHHSSYAIVGSTPIVGISGPSGGASFTLNFYLRPLMRAYLGLEPEVDRVPVKLTKPFPKPPHHGKKPAHKSALAGEKRPKEHPKHAEGEPEFYAVKMLKAVHSENGELSATPLEGRPGTSKTLQANMYYMMPTGPGIKEPGAGDVIYAEWC